MSVIIHWDNPQQNALVLTFTAPWTWDEYEAISERIEQHFESATDEVDLIVDMRSAGDVPQHLFSQFREAYADTTPNLGQYIFVGATPEFLDYLAVIDHYLTALGGQLDYRCADTFNDAQRISYWKHLKRQRSMDYMM